MGQFETRLLKDLPRGVPHRHDLPPAAEWLDHGELARGGWEFKNAKGQVAGLFLGRWQGAEYGLMDDRHVFTVAGSRAGKGASLIIPNLLQYEGSVVAIDPKGELARITAEHREKRLRQDVLVLDPFGVSGRTAGALNPLDVIDLEKLEALDEALGIAEAMIQVPDQGERHWAESAQAVVQALILFVKLLPVEVERNLGTVHDLLMLSHASLVNYAARVQEKNLVNALFEMLDDQGEKILETHMEIGSLLQGIGKTYRQMPDKERESVLSAARTQTRFLRSPALRAVLGTSAIRLDRIKERTTIYLCLPVRRMASHAKWLRVVVNLCLQSFEDGVQPEIPVLMVLDEFNVLGHMKSIETAAGQLASFGVKLWTVLQDIGQIKKEYGQDGWETFVGNAGVLTFFGNTDQTTLEYIAKKLGKRTFLTERPSDSTQGGLYDGAPLMRQETREEALLAPHEISEHLGRGRRSILVLAAEKRPVILERALYHDPKDRFYKLAHGG